MMAGVPAAIETFRDPAGSLRIEGDLVKRRVKPEMAQAALRFLASPLAKEWVSQGRLIATNEGGGQKRAKFFWSILGFSFRLTRGSGRRMHGSLLAN